MWKVVGSSRKQEGGALAAEGILVHLWNKDTLQAPKTAGFYILILRDYALQGQGKPI